MLVNTETSKKVWAISEEKGYRFEVVAVGGMITEPVIVGHMEYRPREQSQIYIPPMADRRMKALMDEVVVVGQIVGEEVPEVDEQVNPAGQGLERILRGLGHVFMFAVGLLALLDPQLIAVVEDENGQCYWVCVAQWLD